MFDSPIADASALAREFGVRGGAAVLTRWQHLQPLWRALSPTMAALGVEARHVAVFGDAAAGALDVLPDDVRATAHVEVFADGAAAKLGRAAYADLVWSSGSPAFPPGYLDLAIVEIDADPRLSERPASFIRRLRADEERLLDLVGALRAGGVAIALFHRPDGWYAIEHTCPHSGGPLAEGDVEGHAVTCPWHGSQFDIRSGALISPPATRPVRAFQVTIEGEDVTLDLS